jgi:type III secretion system TyeA family effector delivery regulator
MPTPDEPMQLGKLLAGLLTIVGSGNALAMQFERLAREMQVPEGAPNIVFLSGIKKMLREMPDRAFADRNARLSMVDAVQDALDKAIEAEEEALENEQADHDGGAH